MARLGLRRLRQDAHIRALTRSVRLDPEQLIQPLFVVEGLAAPEPVAGLAGVFRETPDSLLRRIEADLAAGISKFLLFGIPREKRTTGFGHDFTAGAIDAIRQRYGAAVWLAADVCLCAHTTHGHCGILDEAGTHVRNAASVTTLVEEALAFARAGADCVAPSDMMDGRVGAIRAALDGAGFADRQIMAYAAKYASAFYGPFRDAVGSKAALRGDKRTYQMDPANSDEALREVALDLSEGADMVMVKPGLPYLDICRRVKDTFGVPTYAYQVSGEYAMIQAAAQNGWLDLERCVMESLVAFRRAGCDGILTYFAPLAARLLSGRRAGE